MLELGTLRDDARGCGRPVVRLGAALVAVALAGCGDAAAPIATAAPPLGTAQATVTTAPLPATSASVTTLPATSASATTLEASSSVPQASDPGLSDVDPCALLNTAEIEQAAGNPVEPPDLDAITETTCHWGAADLEDVEVTLTITTPPRPSVVCQGSRKLSEQAGPVTDLPGLGVAAWWEFRGSGSLRNSTVTVCTTDRVIFLGLAGDRTEEALRAASDTLLAAVLTKIGAS